MQVYEERNITTRPHNSFEDQQMCDLLVQILDNQDFFLDNFIETFDTLFILDNEYEGTEHTDQPPDSEEDYQSVGHQVMTNSHRIQATTQVRGRGLTRMLKWRTENSCTILAKQRWQEALRLGSCAKRISLCPNVNCNAGNVK
jgi:hypothetical protein